MSVTRQQNWLGQQRVDIPHLRAVESSIANDFDLLAGTIMGGKKALIVSGFTLVPSSYTLGVSLATALTLVTANGTLVHYKGSEAGSIFAVPSTRADEVLVAGDRIVGNFTPSSVNYVGVDLVRAPDPDSADLVMFLDANTLQEEPKTVPLGRVVDYNIYISTTDFSLKPNLAPIAIITTDANNKVTAVQDARNIMFRLGSGGSTPARQHKYTWASRRENTTGDLFSGGDKSTLSQKDWMDSVMTRLWELGGGEYWYSQTADRNVTLAYTGPVFTSSGQNWEWDGTNLHWKGLRLIFNNSPVYYNTVVDKTTSTGGLTNLADGDCIYVDLDHTTIASLTAAKLPLITVLDGTIPGSRWVLAWRLGFHVYSRGSSYPVGEPAPPAGGIPVATTAILGVVRLNVDSPTPASPAVTTADNAAQCMATGLSRQTFGVGTTSIACQSEDQTIAMGALTVNGITIGSLNEIATNENILVGYGSDTKSAWYSASAPDRTTALYLGKYRIHEFTAWNGSVFATTAYFEGSGALGMVETNRTANYFPATPNNSHAKVILTNNGLAPGSGRRQQYAIMWQDGSITVIAESPLL